MLALAVWEAFDMVVHRIFFNLLYVFSFHQAVRAAERHQITLGKILERLLLFPAAFFIFMPMGEPVICLVAIILERHMEAMAQHDDMRAQQRSDEADRGREGKKSQNK